MIPEKETRAEKVPNRIALFRAERMTAVRVSERCLAIFKVAIFSLVLMALIRPWEKGLKKFMLFLVLCDEKKRLKFFQPPTITRSSHSPDTDTTTDSSIHITTSRFNFSRTWQNQVIIFRFVGKNFS